MFKYRCALSMAGIVAFAPMACPAAQWENIGAVDGATAYIDVSSMKRSGDLVELWALWNFPEAQASNGKPFHSVKQKGLYDCAKRTSTITIYAMYSNRDGLGKLVARRELPENFSPVAKDSAAAAILEFACSFVEP